MLCMYVVFPVKHSQVYVRNYLLCVWIAALMIVIVYASAPDITSIGCLNEAKAADQYDSWSCTLSAVLLVYLTLATMCWWTFIALDLYLGVFSMKKNNSERRNLCFNVYAWGLPLVLVAIGFAGKSFGGVGNPAQFLF